MSTHTPNVPTSKGARNNNNTANNNTNNHRKPSKKMTTPHPQHPAMLSTPPSSPPRNMSPAGIVTDSSVSVHSKKKPPRSGKKPQPRNVNGVSPAPTQNGHRHTNSQPSVATPQAKDIATAYAGPTFHASPAPSALPIPSFFSKSFPESDLAPTLETDSDSAEMEPDLDTTPSKPRSARPHTLATTQAAQPTPLDFLFKAAVQARTAKTMNSPEAAPRVHSPQTDPRKVQANRHTPGGMFPMDLESERARASPIGPSFAPSFQDRLNAFRASSSPSQSPSPALATTAEDQNRMKTEQLKYMLLNPRPQEPPSSSTTPSAQAQLGHYGAQASRPNINATVPHYATPMRTSSGSPAVLSHGYSPVGPPQPEHIDHSNHHKIAGHPSYPYTHANGSQPLRNTNSPLRREVSGTNGYSNGYGNGYYSNGYPSGQSSPVPYGKNHYAATAPAPVPPQSGFVSPQPQYTQAAFPLPTNSPSPSTSRPVDTKKMEDDLRRILKLDAAQAPGPALPSSGMQRSFA
ncbi:hypothetical protein F1880_007568 [Penicillium rolfsii]|nr:hypothetical protein F1880_007568 [Penicillium rolfsii]